MSEEPTAPSRPVVRIGPIVLGRLAVAVLSGLLLLNVGLAYRDYQARQVQHQRHEMVQAARQGLLNLTTIDHERVDQDVQRILDSSTGAFHDDFAKRLDPFIAAARQARSKSVGTVTDAGLESVDGDAGRVLVALTVMTSNGGVPERQPRGWRTRVTVTEADGGFKVSQVEFVG